MNYLRLLLLVGNKGNSKKSLHASSLKLIAGGVGANPYAGIIKSVSAITFKLVVTQIVAFAVRDTASTVPTVDCTPHWARISNGKILSLGTNRIIS